MSDHSKLIAEARKRAGASRLGKSLAREMDRDILMIRALADALEASTTPTEPDPEKLRGAIREALDGQGALHCTRDWSGWGHGTMTEDDFAPASEDPAAIQEITNAVIETLEAATTPVEPGPGDREALMSMMNSLYNWSTVNWDEIADAILAAGFSRPVGGETETEWEYGYRSRQTGSVWGSGSLMDAVMGAQVTDSIVVRRQANTAWLPVSPEPDGGKA